MTQELYIDDPLKDDDVIYATLQQARKITDAGFPLDDDACLDIDWAVRDLFYGQTNIRKNPDKSIILKRVRADIARGVSRKTICKHYRLSYSKLYRLLFDQ